MRTLLIDGDILIYKIATQNEIPTHWGDGLWTLHSDEKLCKAELDTQLEQLKENLEAEKFIIALTDKNNFRKDILPSYKDNRKSKRKPMMLPVLRQYCIDNYSAVIMEGLEADDVLGILATTPNNNDERIVVSIDKDLLQIPSKISRDGKTFDEISEDEANYWHMMQTLCGDATDGYSGCPKVGVKTAQKILGDNINVPLLDLWQRVLAAYAKVGYSTDEALQQARVAKILRYNDYDYESGGIKLWRTS
tara:strand:+ start:12587 stop:13333 length:747 start_codon:yes stop_codon:yes gene_type:complete